MTGPLWQQMDARPRRSMTELKAADIPESPGVYALYRGDVRMYVGKAGCLHDRVWKNHCGRGKVMTSSAMRRNAAEHLGIANANDIKKRLYQPTDDEIAAVREWLDGCQITWVECESKAAARKLEDDFKDEYLPPLTKR
jgi:hypothetical protein